MSKKKKSIKAIVKISAIILGTTFVIMNVIARKKKADSIYENEVKQKNPFEGKKVIFVENDCDKENADGVKGHLEVIGKSEGLSGFYDKTIKRIIDILLSFIGLVILAPVMGIIALAIKVEDPGPAIFVQKRVGQNKKFFKLHKFRSMKMSTPHDVPTHMLDNPEQYITRVGRFLRKHSLDELPQIWDIFIGNMSIIGPRPGLWNQDLLIAERDKYGANNVKPGLTGWAQINGRDEIEIPVKARLDGEYVEKESLFFDARCFWRTISKVAYDNTVIEGGTGKLNRSECCYTNGRSEEELIGHIGFGEPVEVDRLAHKKILITGTGSYIGEEFCTYAEKYYGSNFTIESIDMMNNRWKSYDFSVYDIIFHVAGIAHADVGKADDKEKEKYYAVNTKLAIEVAKKAKAEGVKEFIFMSSMIVYGDSAPYGKQKIIDRNTVPVPENFYGDSKLQADFALRLLANDVFKVIVLRPPMIYGNGSKGNYPVLSKIARNLPIYPDVDNQRSMLYIENLCEFLCQVMLIKEIKENAVVLVPQNDEWTKTSEMIKEICRVHGKRSRRVFLLNPAILFGAKLPGKIGKLVNKAFGNNCYAQCISQYEGIDYQKISLKESILRTEEKSVQRDYDVKDTAIKRKVLFLVNHDVVIYNFRLELVESLLCDGYDVSVSSPYGERIEDLKKLGCHYYELEMERHGMNPVNEIKLYLTYRKLIAQVKPDIILGYTIKPNIYGAMAAAEKNIPFIANITGLGTAVENSGLSQKLIILLYKAAFRKVQKVFFQNTENREFFRVNNIAVEKHGLLPGSGVNLERFSVKEYPDDKIVRFAFISRIMKEKGIDEYLEAAKVIKERHSNIEFHVCGFCEDEYKGRLDKWDKDKTIIYHGMIRDVAEFLKDIHCVIHPTYYPEGLSNVLLEACACGRPIITTDRSGCREVVDDGVNGYMIPQRNSKKLIEVIEKFMKLSNEERKKMGLAGRKKVEVQFDRKLVVEAYMREIENNGL